MRNPPFVRRGISLLEVVISLVVLSLFVHLLMQSTFMTVRTGGSLAVDADLAVEGNAIVREINQDMSLSGWHFVELPVANLLADQNVHYYPKVLQQDPSGGSVSALGHGLSTAFPHMTRTSDRVILVDASDSEPWDHLPGDGVDFNTRFGDLSRDDLTAAEQQAYLFSHRARSQELIFLRAALAPWASDPINQDYELLYFGGPSSDWRGEDNQVRNGVLGMNEWDVEVADLDGNGTVERKGFHETGRSPLPTGYPSHLAQVPDANVDGAFAFLDGAGELHIETRWETSRPWTDVDVVSRLDARVIDEDQLREYIYALIPSELGLGRFVRAYSVDTTLTGVATPSLGDEIGEAISSSAGTYMVIDKIFSDNVSRIVFDTYRTDPELSINEVRMRLYMGLKPTSPQAGVLLHYVERTFTMRTRDNNRDNDEHRANFNSIGADRYFVFPY